MSDENRRMFSSIAPSYDLVNHIISFGKDIIWRRRTARACMMGRNPLRVLDAATGTGDLAFAVAKEARKRGKEAKVIGIDYSTDMLKVAKKKVKDKKMSEVKFEPGDALYLRFRDGSFDIVTSGFALRNFDNLGKFLGESYRVLSPGGKIVLLELSRPDTAVLNSIFHFYYFYVIPAIGGTFYHRNAYVYLSSSIWHFDKNKLIALAKAAGFTELNVRNMTLGTAFIFTARKPNNKNHNKSES